MTNIARQLPDGSWTRTPTLVERLRADRPVTQFDSAGRMVKFTATPTDLEREAADAVESLTRAARELRSAASDYARLMQVENFDRADIAVCAAYERLRKALASF